jgi:sugar phosphate isomerase/epimerase
MTTPRFLSLALLIGVALASGCASPKTVGTSKHFKGPVGLQLYSLRDSFSKDVATTLDQVKAFGFKYVELAGTYGKPNDEFLQMLQARGLKAIAGHFGYEQWRDNPEQTALDAKTLGLEYAGCAWIAHEGEFDEAECRAAAAVFNRAGAATAKHGIKFFYHNHGYEFRPHGNGTLFDLLVRETNPDLVSFEMDLLWTVHPGQDPAALLNKYGSRWELMHLKDLREGVKGDFSGGTDTKNDVALGTGQVDFPAVLKAAQKARVKYYFIEDESPTVLNQIPQSLRYLSTAKW